MQTSWDTTVILQKSHTAREAKSAVTAPRCSVVRAAELPKRSQATAEAGVRWNLYINLSDFVFHVCSVSWERKKVFFAASISHFRGMLMDYWDASWLV